MLSKRNELFGNRSSPLRTEERFPYFVNHVSKARIWNNDHGVLFKKLQEQAEKLMNEIAAQCDERFVHSIMLNRSQIDLVVALLWFSSRVQLLLGSSFIVLTCYWRYQIFRLKHILKIVLLFEANLPSPCWMSESKWYRFVELSHQPGGAELIQFQFSPDESDYLSSARRQDHPAVKVRRVLL